MRNGTNNWSDWDKNCWGLLEGIYTEEYCLLESQRTTKNSSSKQSFQVSKVFKAIYPVVAVGKKSQ
jgi:hypothetical protein